MLGAFGLNQLFREVWLEVMVWRVIALRLGLRALGFKFRAQLGCSQKRVSGVMEETRTVYLEPALQHSVLWLP